MNRICPFEGTRRCSYYVRLRIALVLCAVIVSPFIAVAQSGPPASKRLTIGVALEGGGALGLAHIGVLRWFESTTSPLTISPETAWAPWWEACTRPAKAQMNSNN
jgi:hypothetical protein